jgi:hypothetical protein
MNTLNLNAYNVGELRFTEIRETNGGGFVLDALAWAFGCFLWDTISNPKETVDAMKKGAANACEVEI